MESNWPHNQHYVSQFILRNFSTCGKLWVFDKHTEKVFRTNVRNIMAERDFNCASAKDVIISFEEKFQYLEDKASPVIRKIIEERSLLNLNPMEEAGLHMFMITQHLHAKLSRRNFEIITKEIRRLDPDLEMSPDIGYISDDEYNKLKYFQIMFDNIDKYTFKLLDKHTYLMLSETSDPIYISDSPFVMHNLRQYGPYGNIGLEVPGIEIYHPLSSSIVLAYTCKTNLSRIEQALSDAQKDISNLFTSAFLSNQGIDSARYSQIKRAEASLAQAKLQFERLKKQRWVRMNGENHLYVNSLQLINSCRYIVASENKFDLAKKAMQEHPHWRQGRKVEVN